MLAARVTEDGRPRLIEGATTVRMLDGIVPTNAVLREDASYELREDGSLILRES